MLLLTACNTEDSSDSEVSETTQDIGTLGHLIGPEVDDID